MTGVPTYPISELREVQTRWRLQAVHLVWLGPNSFTIAHTDAERRNFGSMGWEDLEDCPLHQWLGDIYSGSARPAHFGVFVATRSEGPRPFAFTKLDAYEA